MLLTCYALFRFITGLKNISDEKELQYTTDMINDNFSNYSAWHNRRYGHLFQISLVDTWLYCSRGY
ncbi:hypothetical protein Hdeb2414_s0599g00922481 [Helianthus debilis subsp. tardiflorus]